MLAIKFAYKLRMANGYDDDMIDGRALAENLVRSLQSLPARSVPMISSIPCSEVRVSRSLNWSLTYHQFSEAGDHLVRLFLPILVKLLPLTTIIQSQASVSDLNKQLDSARSKSQSTRSGPGRDDSTALRQLFSTLPAGAGGEMASEMDDIERIRAGTDPATGGKKPEEMSPQELHAVLWRVLKFRDSVMKKIEKTIGMSPSDVGFHSDLSI